MNVLHLVRHGLVAGLAGLAFAAHAAGRVDVSFTDTARFTDIGFGSVERERNARSLSQFLQRLGERLPDGQTLKVEVTDVDLAGWQQFGRRGELRVMRGGADWPRIDLRFDLQQDGRSLKAGTESLKDMSYLSPLRRLANEDLPYEKRLLAAWFDERIAPAPAGH